MERLTCVVPTHHRALFLRRLLRFYRECPPGFGFVIVDSSAEDEAAANARVIAEATAAGLQVEHRHIALDFVGKLAQALTEVQTPYVMLCADDDLLFPKACHQCVTFLESHQGYVSAQGRSARLNTGRRWFNCYRTKGYNIEDADPMLRCRKLTANWFTNFYAVYPLEMLRKLFAVAVDNLDRNGPTLIAENLLSQLSACYGRIKLLPSIHNLVQVHPHTATIVHRGQKWNEVERRYQQFYSCLHKELCAVGVPTDDAKTHIESNFSHFRNLSQPSERPRRSLKSWLGYCVQSIYERYEDQNHPTDVRHKRSISRKDYSGSEEEWVKAIQLFQKFPFGIK